MAMRSDRKFAVLILTHGRPDKVISINTLRRAGYTGDIYLVIDDEDKTADRYRELYGDKVVQFSKLEAAKGMDAGDNSPERRSILYARNVAYEIARKLGLTHFTQWDDDYRDISYKFDREGRYQLGTCWVKSLDQVFDACLDFLDRTHVATLAFAQGGDLFGGSQNNLLSRITAKRKSMNTFMCRVDRPVEFQGKLNEDVNTYCELGREGVLFLTIFNVMINQLQTQSNPGGITEMYLYYGTYAKALMAVMYAPSCVKITMIGRAVFRIHHKINSKYAYPKIVPEDFRKPLLAEGSSR